MQVDLENQLEAEQEYILNKLQKQVDKLAGEKSGLAKEKSDLQRQVRGQTPISIASLLFWALYQLQLCWLVVLALPTEHEHPVVHAAYPMLGMLTEVHSVKHSGLREICRRHPAFHLLAEASEVLT